MDVTIKGNTYTLKYSFRALMIYENITQKNFNPQGLSDVVTFFYSVVVASSKDSTIRFDDFIDWLDDNPSSLNEFSNWLNDVYNQQMGISNINEEDKAEKGDDEKNWLPIKCSRP